MNASGSTPHASPPPDSGLSLRARRAGFAALVAASAAVLFVLMALALFPQGPDPLGIAMLLMFGLTLPWTTIGFWNAVVGLLLMRCARDPEGAVAPHLHSIGGDAPITSRTALAICVRNEDVGRLSRNLAWMLDGLVATGEEARRR